MEGVCLRVVGELGDRLLLPRRSRSVEEAREEAGELHGADDDAADELRWRDAAADDEAVELLRDRRPRPLLLRRLLLLLLLPLVCGPPPPPPACACVCEEGRCREWGVVKVIVRCSLPPLEVPAAWKKFTVGERGGASPLVEVAQFELVVLLW